SSPTASSRRSGSAAGSSAARRRRCGACARSWRTARAAASGPRSQDAEPPPWTSIRPRMKLRRVLALTAVSALALPLAACGNKEEVVTHGHTEGSYLNVGNLTYQVQISRQLNPADVTDRSYLIQ